MQVLILIIVVAIIALVALTVALIKTNRSTYIQENIGRNEASVLTAYLHWGMLVPSIIGGLVLVIAVIWMCSSQGADGSAYLIWLVLALIMAYIISLPDLIRYRTTVLAFTDKKVLGKYGLINTKSLDSPLNKINNVAISSGLFGKIFGFGSVVITTSSESFNYRGIMNANIVRTALMEQINRFEEDRIKQQADEMARAMSPLQTQNLRELHSINAEMFNASATAQIPSNVCFCNKCGNQLTIEQAFCSRCGAPQQRQQ